MASVSRLKKDYFDPSFTPDDDEYVSPKDVNRVFKGLPSESPIYTQDGGPGKSGKFSIIKQYIESNGDYIDEVSNSGDSTGPGATGYGNSGFGNQYDIYELDGHKCYVGMLILEEYDEEFVCAPKSVIAKALEVSPNSIEVVH